MKKFLLSGILMLSCVGMFAENYSAVSISYDNTQLMANNKGILSSLGYKENVKNGSLNGFGIQYHYGIGIGSLPMNVEVGAKWSMGFNHQSFTEQTSLVDYENYDYNTTMMRLNIPVSYFYHFDIKDMFTVSPYAGFDFRFNLIANTKLSETWGDYTGTFSRSETYNFFNKQDTEGQTSKRFQLGWHIGARVEYSKFFLGLEYGTDFIPFYSAQFIDGNNKYKKNRINTGTFTLGVGYKF